MHKLSVAGDLLEALTSCSSMFYGWWISTQRHQSCLVQQRKQVSKRPPPATRETKILHIFSLLFQLLTYRSHFCPNIRFRNLNMKVIFSHTSRLFLTAIFDFWSPVMSTCICPCVRVLHLLPYVYVVEEVKLMLVWSKISCFRVEHTTLQIISDITGQLCTGSLYPGG